MEKRVEHKSKGHSKSHSPSRSPPTSTYSSKTPTSRSEVERTSTKSPRTLPRSSNPPSSHHVPKVETLIGKLEIIYISKEKPQ